MYLFALKLHLILLFIYLSWENKENSKKIPFNWKYLYFSISIFLSLSKKSTLIGFSQSQVETLAKGNNYFWFQVCDSVCVCVSSVITLKPVVKVTKIHYFVTDEILCLCFVKTDWHWGLLKWSFDLNRLQLPVSFSSYLRKISLSRFVKTWMKFKHNNISHSLHFSLSLSLSRTFTHTHTHLNDKQSVWLCVCVCVCVCECVCVCVCVWER